MLDLNIFQLTRFFFSVKYCRSLLLLTSFYGHLLAEVASSLGVRSSVCFTFGQINWLIDWLKDRIDHYFELWHILNGNWHFVMPNKLNLPFWHPFGSKNLGLGTFLLSLAVNFRAINCLADSRSASARQCNAFNSVTGNCCRKFTVNYVIFSKVCREYRIFDREFRIALNIGTWGLGIVKLHLRSSPRWRTALKFYIYK